MEGKKIAIITGASSGLGREMVLQLDEENTNIDEFWVIARRRERLEALQEQVKKPLRILAFDLVAPDTMDKIKALLEEAQPDIRLLINAAGFGKIGSYADIPLSQIDRMIELNCRAAVDMTQICIPYMHENSHIMEICSVAGFQPIKYMNVYAASKAFLYRYARALRTELLPQKIYVTAVCPYWIKDTEFISTAQTTGTSTASSAAGETSTTGTSGTAGTSEGADEEAQKMAEPYFRSYPFASTAKGVAATALASTRLGLAVCTPGPIALLDRLFGKVLSSDIMIAIIDLLRRIPGKKNQQTQ